MRALLIELDGYDRLKSEIKIRLIDKSGDPVRPPAREDSVEFQEFWVKPEMLPFLNITLVGHEAEE